MKKIAVIDVGSNSVRLMLMADGKVLYKRLETTRLGEGLAESPFLRTNAIERSANAISRFFALAKSEGADKISAFATAAVRSAENKEEFLSRVYELCGLKVEVVAGETEAELGILGALGQKDGCVIDVGGASTEIVVREQGEITYKKSVNIGAVRLKDLCGRDKDKLISVCEREVQEFFQLKGVKKAVAIGGTATTLATWKLKLHAYDSNAVTGTKITVKEMQSLAEELLVTPVEEIEAFPCMPKGRADILAGGAVLFFVAMKNLGIGELTVSDRDNLEGYAIKKGWTE